MGEYHRAFSARCDNTAMPLDLIRHDGFPLPASYSVEHFVSGQNLPARPSDVFVCAYPDCGTSWVLGLVNALLREDEHTVQAAIDDAASVPHLERDGREACERMTSKDSVRLFRTHLPYDRTPRHPDAKYIVVGRNPKDTSASFYHRHIQDHARWDAYFEDFLDGNVEFGDFFDFFVPWFEHHSDNNVLFLTYEYLLAEPRDGLLRIARFLGQDALEDRLVEHNSTFLRAILHAVQTEKDRIKVGGWRRLYTPEQSAAMDERFSEMTEGTGAEHMWSDLVMHMAEKEALEAELARELAALNLDDDDVHDEDEVVEGYCRLDLDVLLVDIDDSSVSRSEVWRSYAAATAQYDADLFAMLESSLQDLAHCTLTSPATSSHPLPSIVVASHEAHLTSHLVDHSIHSPHPHDGDDAVLSCPDHCTPMCFGPCAAHCGPRCAHFQALQAADASAQAAAAAENDRFMRLALASVAQIGADVRHVMSVSLPLEAAHSSTLPRSNHANAVALSGSALHPSVVVPNNATPDTVSLSIQNVYKPLSRCLSAIPCASPPSGFTACYSTPAEVSSPSTILLKQSEQPRGDDAANLRIAALHRSQVEFQETEHAMAAYEAQVEAARRQRAIQVEAETAALAHRRLEDEAASRIAAQHDRQVAQEAIESMYMMAEEREGTARRRQWRREAQARHEGDERRLMGHEEARAGAMRRDEQEAMKRLEMEAQAREQRRRLQQQHEDARRRQHAERCEMETQETHQRKVDAVLQLEQEAKEKQKQQQIEQEKRQIERRKLAAAKQALEEIHQLEKQQQREALARQQLEAEQQQLKRQRDDAVRQQIELVERQRESRQRHFQREVLGAVRSRLQESSERQLLSLEEHRSALVIVDEKAQRRTDHLTKWWRRWQRRIKLYKRLQKQKTIAAVLIQHAWRALVALRTLRQAQVKQQYARAALRVQRGWRQWRHRKQQTLMKNQQNFFKNQRAAAAATTVQAAYRGYFIRNKLAAALASVTVRPCVFVDGDEFEYDEVDLDAFLGGAPEIDDDDDERDDVTGPLPPLPRPGWADPLEEDEDRGGGGCLNTSPHPVVPHNLFPSQVDVLERGFCECLPLKPPAAAVTKASSSSLYKRMQNAIAHGRKGKKSNAAAPKQTKDNNNTTVVSSVTWSSSGRKAKKVNVPSLVDRLRKTTAATR
ncbi:hypothetical protein DYB26_002474 [Aphanomyces astaci]|uniref:Sulfotransferase domain-containing protein n=1 Tax=Aphanomyces astaci TaxID=112090 RepID=A0A418CHC7_APHAT|nr:hypothetical protein DYB26_002474 [Aphanomyces astaci]